jgi:hypothetical protein
MAKHEFQVGQTVFYAPRRIGHPVGRTSCKIVRLLPSENGGELQYRIRCTLDAYDRIAPQSHLSAPA